MTKTELIEHLGTSRGTLYRHMAKLGIDKGKKLSEEDVVLLEKSIGRKKVIQKNVLNSIDTNVEQNETMKRIVLENEKLCKENSELKERILHLEQDNRNLLGELSNSLAMHNQVNKEYSSFVSEMKSLVAPKQEEPQIEKQESEIIKEPVHEEVIIEKTPPRQKKWWRR